MIDNISKDHSSELELEVITSPAGVCVSVCREHISRITCAICTTFLVHVAYCRGAVLLRRVDTIPRRRSNVGVFPIDNALYSITFGTHTKTAEPIEMPFRLMTRVGPKWALSTMC